MPMPGVFLVVPCSPSFSAPRFGFLFHVDSPEAVTVPRGAFFDRGVTIVDTLPLYAPSS